ncbi:MAG: rubrerythrin family protein [Bdellovibrionales bacterium]|jgi:rubrerythrin|nr:rubrerythrin family protein [Bdellovibrionales bacterium]MBT3524916.1 rubrerythrin family protein [Bdellovibrionales bacterium]MBT7668063.1 rubrerythrin family protein [Bdellovibrionales bacterium]MBT7767459.1 rubrerythrin family protein [Bdellovibrionales bacterium]
MATTMENLAEAFAGESQANRKYLAFAQQADKDGFKQVAKLFRAAAEAETIHAHGHLKAMDGVKSTEENLEAAIAGETFEYKNMYPAMLEQAEKDNHPAKRMFKWAMETEEIHANFYQMALAAVKAGRDLADEVYLCPLCGHLEFKNPPANCPVCGVPADKYVLIG